MAAARSCMLLTGRGAEQHSKGVDTVHSLDQPGARPRPDGQAVLGLRLPDRAGQRPGRPRARAEGRPAPGLPPHRDRRRPRVHRGALGRRAAESLPRKGKSAFELLDALGPAGIRGLFVMGSNVAVASPDATRVDARLRSLDFLAVCDAFENDTTAHAHVVLPVAQWAEEEGTDDEPRRPRVSARRVSARMPRGVRTDVQVLHGNWPSGWASARSSRSAPARTCSPSCAGPPPGPRRLLGHHLRQDRRERRRVLAVPGRGPPRHAADVHGALPPPGRQGQILPGDAPRRGRGAGRRVPADFFTTGRYKEHYNSGAQTRLVARLRPRSRRRACRCTRGWPRGTRSPPGRRWCSSRGAARPSSSPS